MKTEKPIILNPELIPEPSTVDANIHSYVCELKIYVEPHLETEKIRAGWTSYYFQNKYEESFTPPIDQILAYKGSTEPGKKNQLKKEMLDAIEATTKPLKYRLIKPLVQTKFASLFEYLATLAHREKDKRTCWNQTNAGGGKHWGKINGPSIAQYITATEILSKMLKTLQKLQITVDYYSGQLLTKNAKARQLWTKDEKKAYNIFCKWNIGEITVKNLKELIETHMYVQCREMDGGNKATILKYEKKMDKLTSWFSWKGFVVLLMNKDGSVFKLLDGNSSARAAIKSGNISKLSSIEIPYEYWNKMEESELITLGDDANIEPDDTADFSSKGDLERDILATLKTHQLYTPIQTNGAGGNPQWNNPVLLLKFSKHNEIIFKEARRSINALFKQKSEARIRDREGSLDYSADGLQVKRDKDGRREYNANRIGYAQEKRRIRKIYNRKFSTNNTVKINADAPHIPAKVVQNVVNKFHGNPPKNILVEIEFKNLKAHDNFPNTKKGELIKNTGFWPKHLTYKLTFERLNPVVK